MNLNWHKSKITGEYENIDKIIEEEDNDAIEVKLINLFNIKIIIINL